MPQAVLIGSIHTHVLRIGLLGLVVVLRWRALRG